MKKLSLFIFITFFLTSIIIAIPQGFAHAQDPVCTDAAGGVIPCPPTAEISCGQAGGPACPATENRPNPTPRPTKTPFPLANPTQETVNAGASWSGSCENAGPVNDPCLLKLMDACFDAGGDSTVGNPDDNGTVTVTCALPAVRDPNAPLPLVAAPTRTPLPDENYLGSCTNADRNVFDCFEKFKCEDGLFVIKVDLYSGNGTKYDFYCIPDESVPQLDLPLTNPTEDSGTASAEWSGICKDTTCIGQFTNGCTSVGGTVTTGEIKNGEVPLTCKVPLVSEPTPLPLAAAIPTRVADGDWVGGCNFGDNYDFCMEDYKASCNNEGGVYNESHDDEGSNVSCSDTTDGRPNSGFPGGWFPWIIGLGVVAAALSVQGVRKYMANAKTAEAKQDEHENPEGYMKKAKRMEADGNKGPKEAIEINSWSLGGEGGGGGGTPKPPPPPPPPPPAKK